MPVLVTGAEFAEGRAVARALLAGGGEVRVFADPLRVDIDPLRALGAKVARGQLDDEGLLEMACEQVHTVVHCAAAPLEAPAEVLDGLASVLSAAIGAGCRRLILVSWIGGAGTAWGTAMRAAEELLVDAPLETVVLRRALTYGPEDPLTEALGAAMVPGTARHAPLLLDDLAAAVATADSLRRGPGAGDAHLLLELAGPDVVTLDELAAALAPGRARPLPPHVVELLGKDTPPTAGGLGGSATSLAAGAARVRG